MEIKNDQIGKKNVLVINRKVCYTEGSLPSSKHFKTQEISFH